MWHCPPISFASESITLVQAGMKFREIIKLIEDDGWYQVHQAGSHRQYKHPIKQGRVTVAGHPGKDVREGTRQSILKQAGLRGK